MDTVYPGRGESNDLQRRLLKRFPLGSTMRRSFTVLDGDERWDGICVNLDTGAWFNPDNRGLHGDTIDSLFAALDEAAAEAALAAAIKEEQESASDFPHTVDWWLTRDIKPPEALLGEVIYATSRTFIGGPTGIGKSHLALAMAAGMATGQGFAQWSASRPVRTLYVDGEMPRDLVLSLLRDLSARMGGADLSNLLVLCREDFEDMEPFNTGPGRDFILKKIKRWGVEAVFFDNRMSLTAGDMRDEEGWSATMSLVKELSKERVAQVWMDHTGHETGRVYGTKTKEWSFDNVVLLTKIERPETDIAFQIKFEKARRRRPATRADFEAVTFTLSGDQWTTDADATAPAKAKMAPMCREFYRAFLDALCITVTTTPGSTTRAIWFSECVRKGIATEITSEDRYRDRESKRRPFRKYMANLKALGLIGIDGETVHDLQNPRTVTPL